MSVPQPRSEDRGRTKTALILSAGAPHSPLMAGALCAIHCALRDTRKGFDGEAFDIIYTSGAGALIGLLLAAPKCGDPEQALRSIVELGVSDPIYSLLPINYKAFHKPGPFTKPIQRMAQAFKLGEFPIQPIPDPVSPLGYWYNYWVAAGRAWRNVGDGGMKRLYNDLVDLWAAAITPTTLTFWSKGVCDPLPFIEELVDFPKLNEARRDFFLNFVTPRDLLSSSRGVPRPGDEGASGTGRAMKLFESGDIKPDHVRAAFAFPFIYTPVRIDRELSFEGANWEPISFGNLLTSGRIETSRIKSVVLIDIVSNLEPFLLREPRNLWDAFGLSIILPVVAHAKKELSRFTKEIDEKTGHHKKHGFKFLPITFDIGEDAGAHILDWSHSNMSKMFDIGYRAGEEFYQKNSRDL